MKNLRTLLLISCLAYLAVYLTPKAKAGEWDRKTVLSFSQPVEIPGIVLPAGTYVFSFLGSTADRNIIEVLSQDEQKVYATIEAIPDYQANATGETSIVYMERKAGAPQAIKEWFFPDRRYGHEFVYPETGALEIANADESTDIESDYLRLLHQTQPLELAKADEPEIVNKTAESPEVGYLELVHRKQMEALGQTPVQTAMAKELPRTGSPLPLVGLSGVLLLAASVGLRLYFKQVD